jgi:GTP-binding protein TypA/BipA
MAVRSDLRNIGVIAHVDHGKTTLVDAMLWQSGAFSAHQQVNERVMDSGDLEREKGITILAKNTAVSRNGMTINILDTPGHADFGGEVERALGMVDGVLLLVDSSEGPLPQTRFVLRKTLELNLPIILVVNKIDRPDARIDEVIDEVFDLFIDLGASDEQIDIPTVFTNARDGIATLDLDVEGTNLDPLFDTLIETVPAPEHDPDHPFQAMVSSLTADPYVGRIAVARIRHGNIKKGQTVAWSKLDGTIVSAKINELYKTDALDRVAIDTAGPGDIIQIAGIPEITVGETLTDLEDPRPLVPLSVDEPSLGMTLGINTSPLAGQDGKKVTARLLENRLKNELVGNVSLRVLPTERPDVWEVLGRGELQLAILVETMRREGFELTVGKPQVVTKEIDGKIHEPVEHLSIDVPDDYVGVVTSLIGLRKGRMLTMQASGTEGGWSRVTFRVPARGLIGFRTEFLTETRGTGMIHATFDGYEPWFGEIKTRPNGSLVADRLGVTTPFALMSLQERGALFTGPGIECYEGMIIGENAREEDMDVNPAKEKKQTNVRSSGTDEAVRLAPPRQVSLEQALEWIREDEAVEVTPNHVRMRKTTLDMSVRSREMRNKKRGDAPSR